MALNQGFVKAYHPSFKVHLPVFRQSHEQLAYSIPIERDVGVSVRVLILET